MVVKAGQIMVFAGEAKAAAIQNREDFSPVCEELLMRVPIAIQVVSNLL